MKAERKLAITLFSAVLLSSCVSSVSDYCFYKARVADEGVWFEQEPREMYKVRDTYYAKAKRGSRARISAGLALTRAVF